MRRNTILAVILLLRLYSLANEPIESKTRYYRHEVNVSIGRIGVRSGWSNDYENDVMNRFGLVVGRAGEGHGPGTGIVYEQKDKPNLGTDNLLKTVSYYYHFNHHVAVGGLFGFCLLSDLAARAGRYGTQRFLSFFLKSPMHDYTQGEEAVNNLYQQYTMLKNAIREMGGYEADEEID